MAKPKSDPVIPETPATNPLLKGIFTAYALQKSEGVAYKLVKLSIKDGIVIKAEPVTSDLLTIVKAKIEQDVSLGGYRGEF